MSSKNIAEYLYSFGTSSQYNQPIPIAKQFNFNSFVEVRHEHQTLNEPIEIVPPSVQLQIDPEKCLPAIKRDVEYSRRSKNLYLLSQGKGNNLVRSLALSPEDDIRSVQAQQNCQAVLYSLVKDVAEDCARQIGLETRSCFMKKIDIFGSRDEEGDGKLDDITKAVYQNYRNFLIFDCKSQPGRVTLNFACFFPNVPNL